MTKSEMIAKLVSAPCCEWPECRCARKYQRWEKTLARWCDEAQPPASEAELDAALIEIELVLACIAKRCSSKRNRAAAIINLLHPVFDKVPQAEARLCAADSQRETDEARQERLQ